MEKEKHVWTKGLFAFFLCISALSLSAQTITVRGIVTDRNNEPLIGVTIRVEGYENQGTVTDMDGKYMLVGVRKLGIQLCRDEDTDRRSKRAYGH